MKYKTKLGAIAIFGLTAAAAMSQQIQVIVHGNTVNFEGQGPMMSGERVLVPLRGVLEELGAEVDWNPDTQSVSARREGTNVKLRIGGNTAAVNGHPVNLDVPAQIINGSTMVPLRFVSEALGEHVRWEASTNTVNIDGNTTYDLPKNDRNRDRQINRNRDRNSDREDHGRPQPIRTMTFPSGSVFPVTLNDSLSSNGSARGDRFTATVNESGSGLPRGTRIEGFVEAARPRKGDRPGMLELEFDRIKLADGGTIPITGRLIGLDSKSVTHKGGRIVAKDTSPNNRAVFAGYGAGAGLIVGLATKKPLEDTAIGGLLGYLAGSLDKSHPTDVRLSSNTQFGVRLNQGASIPTNGSR